MNDSTAKKILICDTQPIAAEGLRNLISSTPGLVCEGSIDSLEAATQFLRFRSPDLVLLDKGLGMQLILDWLRNLKQLDVSPLPVVWGVSMTEAEALRLLQAGARGIVRKTAELTTVRECLQAVAEGRCWMENCGLREINRAETGGRTDLTPREQ